MDWYVKERLEEMTRDAIDNLRARVAVLERDVETLRENLASERVDRQDAVESLNRVLQSRTEHLV